jgi:hypothetical protein
MKPDELRMFANLLSEVQREPVSYPRNLRLLGNPF